MRRALAVEYNEKSRSSEPDVLEKRYPELDSVCRIIIKMEKALPTVGVSVIGKVLLLPPRTRAPCGSSCIWSVGAVTIPPV